MTPERWKKINQVFQSVVELKTDQQKAYLEEVCLDDESLRQQVETLIAADNDAGAFISGNAADDVGHLLSDKKEVNLAGESLGHYEIVSELGSGGMGKVYLAKDSKLNRSIAVKTLSLPHAPDSDYVKRFQTEAEAAATLNHPNVATVYSVEETADNQLFITMEYVEGKPFGKMIPTNGLDQQTFLEWFISLADALTHAHEKGIVHRDIKPNNIIVTPAGVPKILDFGLARISKSRLAHEESTLGLTKTGQVLGTPAYMSPEQAEGGKIDHRTDIFSFGVVMYEAFTGQRPFKGNSYASVVSELMTKDPDPVAELKNETPYLLSRLIMKCLSKDPRRRYQSMNEVRVILREIDLATASGSLHSMPNQMPSSKSKGYSPQFLYATIGLLSLLGVFAAWSWFSSTGETPKPITRFAIRHEKSARLSVLGSSISPDGKKLLFGTFRSDGEEFHIRSLDTFDTKPIAGTERGKAAFFSPDGKWIAFSTKSDSFKKVPIEGGSAITLCESCRSSRSGMWGADGNIYYSSPKGLLRVSADGGTPEQLTTVDIEKGEKEHYNPQLLPNGKSVLFTVGRNEYPKMALLSLADKQWSFIEETGNSWYGKYIATGHIVFARGKQLMAIPFNPNTLETTGKPVLALADMFEIAPQFQVSDNGTLIYLQTISRTNNQVVWVDRNGRETPALDKRGDFKSPKLSPDGTRIAVSMGDDIWVYNVETGGGIRITFEGKNEIPLWSTDGLSVIYASERDSSFTINKKNANGTGKEETLHSGKYRLLPYSLHPNDRTLAISESNQHGDSDIVTKSLDNDSTESIVATRFREDTPRFSPDGKFLTYFSMDTGEPKIYVTPWNDRTKKLSVTEKSGMSPLWSPDGKEIFYKSAGKLFSVRINTGTAFEVSKPSLLFQTQQRYLTLFDVAPGGEKFLMVRDEHGVLPSKLNVALNWTEELKRILKSAK